MTFHIVLMQKCRIALISHCRGYKMPSLQDLVGTYHVLFTRNHSQFTPADDTTERACYFCRLCPFELSDLGMKKP